MLTPKIVRETNEIVTLSQKPSPAAVRQMVAEYYDEISNDYELLNLISEKRKLHNTAVNNLIAEDLQTLNRLSNLLSIGAGTGEREISIRAKSGLSFEVSCTDLSARMCEIAAGKGLRTLCGAWEEPEISFDRKFDAVTFLSSFGNIPDHNSREFALHKVGDHLGPGCPLYLDALSVRDDFEWGPRILRDFEDGHLERNGYERGDVFYRRLGGKAVAYYHYFEESELIELFNRAEFEVEMIWYVGYGANSGQLVANQEQGAMLFKAARKH